MKKTKLLGISLLLVFSVTMLINIVCAGEPHFVCIEDKGRYISVLATGDYDLNDILKDAEAWASMGICEIKYYKDKQMRESDLIATYHASHFQGRVSSLKRDYLNSSNLPPAPETPCFEAIFAITGLFAVAYLFRRRKGGK